nr:energy transducer TonB [uncultured Rhodopila sp.]
MLVSKILFSEPLEADRLPLTAAGVVRWPGAARVTRPPVLAIGCAILLHVAVCALTLAFVREPPAPSPPDEQTVTLVFEPPEAPQPPAPEPAAAPEVPPEAVVAPPPELPAPAIVQPPEPPPPPRAEAKPVEPPKPPAVRRPAAKAKTAESARVAEPSKIAEPSAALRPGPPAAEAPITADWQHSLAAWLAAHKVYPELARQRRVEGSVVLRFTADRSGRVLNVELLSGSGSPLLDAAAKKLVGDALLPPFPPGMPQQTATLTVPIRYALAN